MTDYSGIIAALEARITNLEISQTELCLDCEWHNQDLQGNTFSCSCRRCHP